MMQARGGRCAPCRSTTAQNNLSLRRWEQEKSVHHVRVPWILVDISLHSLSRRRL
jgi:hypothetical protein